ncbi:carbon-nitrogen hydrolase family protein [bacterium]|nr:MAG: carbon-nitrogen hydrolase family protein [bacterium]
MVVVVLSLVQTDVAFGDPGENVSRALAFLRRLKSEGSDLVVFPEAYVTGYAVDDEAGAAGIAISAEDLTPLKEACDELDILCVVGFAERDAEGAIRNSAALFEPGVAPRVYRKTHLPYLGLDRFVTPGDELPVYDTRLGRIGILICFDLRPPEATRTLALSGADILLLPTNWPEGAEVSADSLAPARANENKIFVATCNRVGEENGFRFIGRSGIYDVSGRPLAKAGDEETVLTAEIDLSNARQKRTVLIPGRYETEVFASRRPELYGSVAR